MNIGPRADFPYQWAKSFLIAYVVAVPVVGGLTAGFRAEAARRRAHGDANEAARLLDIAPDRLGGLVGKREAAR